MSMADGLAWERADRERAERAKKVATSALVMDYLHDAPDEVREAFVELVGADIASDALRVLFMRNMS